ncbi:class I SAM-dependent methyltransferase [Niveibacterium microcysteis]|uniref:Methyltransferase domain-containing protein n=1 Tax=Niveibacterium microcysteis TaxID=2811415 RepID=A0ABX7M6F4_9RHOO|nr:class I SAM-dependent methyltransferase [Niveibacterium microcysteis]QSI77332.1 methyltransferase domain-containing protein [Niveibacterium microcysteis]
MAHAEVSTLFTDKVRDYIVGRPGYPVSLAGLLMEAVGARPGQQLADVGCGTGLLAQAFLQHGFSVTGVEPNDAMRTAGAQLLSALPSFRMLSGTAERTGLPDASVDGIVVGTAFHWFDPLASRTEFSRILRPRGWVALIGNERAMLDPADRALGDLLAHFRDDAHEQMRMLDDCAPAEFLGPATRHFEVPHRLSLDHGAFVALVFSRSYMPRLGTPRRAEAEAMVDDTFSAHAAGGRYALNYRATVYATAAFGGPAQAG